MAKPGDHAHASRHSFSLREFVHTEAFGGVLLMIAAIAALAWANSPWGGSYDAFWNTKLDVGVGPFGLDKPLRLWVNDALMAIFFLVVGLEIKREVVAGELASPRRAALPAIAALGGAVVPALIYLAINRGTPGAVAWGVPMATDIAFALGVLALLGSRVPAGLRIFLAALAIADDILAVLVIAVFYTTSVNLGALGLAAAVLVALVAANRRGVRALPFYVLAGIVLWAAVFASGVHATVAGVLLALTIPANTRLDPEEFVERANRLLTRFLRARDDGDGTILTNPQQQEALAELEDAVEGAGAPLQRLEHTLHPWVAFAIVPVFALANAGVRLEGDLGAALADRVTLGVVVGLVVGKQVGIMAATWLAVKSGLTRLPRGVHWRDIYGAAWLAGIGFTMSLFVAGLAFEDAAEAPLLAAAKIGILAASVVAGIGGTLWLLRFGSRPRAEDDAAG